MKFWTGFVLGAAIGGLMVSSTDAERRRRLVRSATRAAGSGRSGEIAASLSDGVGGIADVATERVTTVVETASTRVAESIEAS